MAQNQFSTAGLLPSGVLQPYGQNILKYGIGQLGRPIDVGALTGKVAGPSAFQQKAAQQMASMYGMGDVQRDASGMVTGFKDATGVASYQPLCRSNLSTTIIRSVSRIPTVYVSLPKRNYRYNNARV